MSGFVPPTYPYDKLDWLKDLARTRFGEVIDCSVGTPIDPPPSFVTEALSRSNAEHAYPPSIGTVAYRNASAAWLKRTFDVRVDAEQELAACVGSKEFVASVAHYLHLRNPAKDTVLYPSVSYPSYAMGAQLAGCRAVPVPMDDEWRTDLKSIDPSDISRAHCLWINSPGNPAGGLEDLQAAAAWGRANDVLVISDECYVEFTWHGVPQTILSEGTAGVLSVHSLSKRSNLAGLRVGFYAGDREIVRYLSEVRKHAGAMVAGPAQHAAALAWGDQQHVAAQRERYSARLQIAQEILQAFDVEVKLPKGGFYLWAKAPNGDAWALAEKLARNCGLIASPGEFYGDAASEYIRLAAVQPNAALELALKRARANQL